MNDIQRQVIRARKRINLGKFFRGLVTALTAGLLLGCLAFAIPRIWALNWMQTTEQLSQWQIGWAVGSVVIGLLGAVMYAVMRATRTTEAALELDQRFGLKERVSSALTLSSEDAASPAGRSLLADAQERAARIDVRDQFAFQPTRCALLPLIPAAIMVGLLFVPPRELPESVEVTKAVAEKKQVQMAIEETKKKIEEQAKKLAEKGLEKAAEDVKALARELDELTPENSELKKEALIKFNDLKKQLDEEKAKLGDAEELKKEFGRLKDVAPGPGKEMADAMKEGDFDKAKKVVEDLAKKLKDGKLSEVEKQKLGENLNELAKAVDEMAKKHEEDKRQLEEMIRKACEDGDPQKAAELQEKLDQKKNQDQQIQKMQKMADKLKECANCMGGQNGKGKPNDKNGKGKEGDKGQSKDGEGESDKGGKQAGGGSGEKQMQDAQKALDEIGDMMEEIQKDQEAMEALKDLEADLNEGKEQCQNPGQGGKQENKGDFAKGEGRGHGKRDLEETDTKGYKSQVRSKLQKGQSIVAGEAEGENAKSGSVIEAREMVKSSMSKDSDPIEDQQLPKAQREQARQYFEKLRKGK
jgi:hypothetical protein